ncbi:hypothetical protein CEXT_796951 [Caerostris extrusa]|uniref:Uncharacterized protein n=1 Tax=Caerostris extrusa TaxID=172846 RepID=A0AAV4NY49_CAEEX|nr:hypothetical protein CEXT_796951 [Caerostris extrusa]
MDKIRHPGMSYQEEKYVRESWELSHVSPYRWYFRIIVIPKSEALTTFFIDDPRSDGHNIVINTDERKFNT